MLKALRCHAWNSPQTPARACCTRQVQMHVHANTIKMQNEINHRLSSLGAHFVQFLSELLHSRPSDRYACTHVEKLRKVETGGIISS